ncbi:MAG: DNA helicase UvrD, partial [Bacteroidia bacterium]|nr:DNA helicase UvrD [Bacteroidia bacterium]
ALNYLLETKLNIDNKHSILERYKDSLLDVFFKDLEEFNFYFNLNEFSALPFYEAIELIIYSFKLAPKSNAYIQFFLDFVLEFSEKTNPSLNAFLEHFHLKEDNLSIISPEGNNAVQIMTIHKAKGLEFPVVIFPFADLNIYYSKNDNIWFPLDSEEFNAFEYALIGFNKSIESMGEIGNYLYHKTKAEKELDNINLLYVALTRAIEQLHIISHKDLDSKNNEKLNNFSGLFINYLKDNNLWEDHKTHYTFGDAQKTTKTEEYSNTKKNETLISVPKKQHQLNIVTASGYLWDTHQEEAIEKGNLIHLILSKIKTKHDIPFVFKEFLNAGQITQDQESHLKPLILKTVEHPKLKTYFSTDSITYNEHDIISNSGKLIRPDKLVILPKNKAVLIDYKTGAHEKIHIQQLEEYQEIIEEMDFNISMKILVYINNEIDIKEV